MPQRDINAIIEKMVAAGESDEDIDLVVSSLKQEAPAESGGVSPWLLGAGAAAVGGGIYAATRNPGAARTAFNGLNDARRMSMLSGLAPLKSVLGNVGSSVYSSIERGSMAPLREMLSLETLKDFGNTLKSGNTIAHGGPLSSAGPVTGIAKYDPFSRFMGAADTAARNALVRAGLTDAEAAKEMLQAPVRGNLMDALHDNPVGEYLVPFKRTPMNQLAEGLSTFKPENLQTAGQLAAQGTAIGSGYVAGRTADDPKTLAMGTAFSGRRGLPFAAGAAIGRYHKTGSGRLAGDVVQGMSPASDYSLSEGMVGPFSNPLGSVIPKPALFNAATYLKSLLGID